MTGPLWVELPSGARVRGRRMADLPAALADGPADLLVALADGPSPGWAVRRIDWPDYGLPADPAAAIVVLTEALGRARAGERVEVACLGGRGRTGTAIAALAVLDGLDPALAVGWVRTAYRPDAVETSEQADWVAALSV